MSLDVYLKSDIPVDMIGTGIYVRKNGKTKELTLQEAKEQYPEFDDINESIYKTDYLYSDNITHNLGLMAKKAGIYKHLWRPEEIGITIAKELINPLRNGLHKLKSNPDVFKKYNPDNGWGTYEILVKFVEDYLDACYKYPDAEVEVSR